jgi:hypothetical protein
MPTIRIDDEVWKVLQDNAKPFVDTPNDVLRRLLIGNPPEVLSRPAGMQPKPSRIGRTQEAAFRRPILESLVELGGRAPVSDVLSLVLKKVKPILRPVDFEEVKSGDERWRNTAMWERKHMLSEGLLASTSPRGIWEITETGREWLRGD